MRAYIPHHKKLITFDPSGGCGHQSCVTDQGLNLKSVTDDDATKMKYRPKQ